MAETYSTKKINELDTVNSADDSDIMMVGKTSTGATSAISKSNFLKEVTSDIAEDKTAIEKNANAISEIWETIYPVGSIYMSMNSTSPSKLFGGEWRALEDVFLLGASEKYEIGSTGGEAEVTLTSSQIPSHTHSLPSHSHSLPSHTHSFSATTSSGGSHTHTANYDSNSLATGSNTRQYRSSGETGSATFTNSAGSHTHSISGTTGATSGTSGTASGTSDSAGGSGSHNNMPPYLSVYMWQRVD